MSRICVTYASGSGRTRALAEEIAAACDAALIDVTDMTDANWETLDAAPAIIFGSPTYMGGVSSGMAAFLETASNRWDNQLWGDKIAAGFTGALHPSGDKLMVLMRFAVFAAQMGMIWVGQNQIGAPVVTGNDGINRDGSWLGLMASDPGDGSVLSEGDKETARRFGARIKAAVHRWG